LEYSLSGRLGEKMSYLEKVFEADIPDEWRWERIRIHRDNLLKDSDWRMVEDAPWDKTAWVIYRQALRDLPQSVTNPADIVFPNPPA
jgi:hypothetical protein